MWFGSMRCPCKQGGRSRPRVFSRTPGSGLTSPWRPRGGAGARWLLPWCSKGKDDKVQNQVAGWQIRPKNLRSLWIRILFEGSVLKPLRLHPCKFQDAAAAPDAT
eukprot:3939933-Rhodomonas_salina.3